MDATAMEGGAVKQEALPVRTAAPVRHADRIEFASKEWVKAARAYLAPRVAERRDALRWRARRRVRDLHGRAAAPRLRG